MNITSLSAVRLSRSVARKDISAEEVVRAYLENIDNREEKISAYISVFGEKAISRARALDKKKEKGMLAGVPLALKDNIMKKGTRTTCASKMLENFISPYSATVTERLERHGAIFLGKTNMDEFAMGSSTENSAFSITKNPWNMDMVPGGSSGGSAAAVAAGEALAAIGSDTGGSVRQPASFCGLVGLKPTYGRISRYGLIAFASSFDQIGPIARSVEDSALLTQIMAGYDSRDSTVSSHPVPDYSAGLKERLGAVKAAYLGDKMLEGVDAEVRRLYFEGVRTLEKEGVELVEMFFPLWDCALNAYYVIAPCEASSNLARYDGVRFGYRFPEPKDLREMYTQTRTEGFGQEVRRRIMLGTFALSAGYYDDYYVRASNLRSKMRDELSRVFRDVDFILSPTSPETAFPIGAKQDPVAMYLSDRFTVVANLTGLPAISIPVGLSGEGLPVGFQIIGKFFQELSLFKLAILLEKNVRFSQVNNF